MRFNSEIDIIKDLAPTITMTVKITMASIKKWQMRVWIATQLFKLGAWIMNIGIEIEK